MRIEVITLQVRKPPFRTGRVLGNLSSKPIVNGCTFGDVRDVLRATQAPLCGTATIPGSGEQTRRAYLTVLEHGWIIFLLDLQAEFCQISAGERT